MRHALAALVLVAAAGSAAAETLRVIDTAPNDVLNIREYPTSTSRIIGCIPPNGRGIRYSGDGVGSWIFVRYGPVEGWVSGRYVEPEPPAMPRGRVIPPGE